MYNSYLKSVRGSLLGCLHGKHLHLVKNAIHLFHLLPEAEDTGALVKSVKTKVRKFKVCHTKCTVQTIE